MIKINKGNVPKVFHDTKSKHNSYDELSGEEKDRLKEFLINEQNKRCVYCMCRIDMKKSTVEHYVPRNGVHGDISKSLDYKNLFAVCTASRGEPPDKQTCDVKKGDKLLHIDPLNDNHINTICYDKKGKVGSNNSEYDDDINNILNLNTVSLMNQRKSAFDGLLQRMASKKNGAWKKEYIERELNRFKAADNNTPYVGYIIYRLEERLKKF